MGQPPDSPATAQAVRVDDMELPQHDSRLAPEVELLTPGDVTTIQAVFDSLSAEQRRQRFHAPMPVLPRYVRRLLADVDGVRHTAMVLRVGGRPAGIARYVVTVFGEAEASIAVASEFTQRGYGTGLLEELMVHAYGHGITRLRFEFLADNLPARRLVQRHGATFLLDGAKYYGVLPTAPATSALGRHTAAG